MRPLSFSQTFTATPISEEEDYDGGDKFDSFTTDQQIHGRIMSTTSFPSVPFFTQEEKRLIFEKMNSSRGAELVGRVKL